MRAFLSNQLALILVAALVGAGVLVFLALGRQEPIPEAPAVEEKPQSSVLREEVGRSVEGRTIEAYTFGAGSDAGQDGNHLLFVGGIHGGYEWNSVLLSYRLIDFLEAEPERLPAGLSVTVIPVLNPDGLYDVVGREGRFALADVNEDVPEGTGRFNANDVDLNRNFDCKWQPESRWRGEVVSAGTASFSEPEARALREHVLATEPVAAVFFHSKAGAVYASECEEGILPETLALMNTYARASGYQAVDTFDAYPITGDAEGWLASLGIPAVTVELATRESVEWERNRQAIEALFARYGSRGEE